MGDSKRIISGYEFANDTDYENAKKEAESVLYIKAHTDLSDEQQLLKLYNKASDMKMFKTVIGYEFMHQLYGTIIKKKLIEAEYMKTIPIVKQASNVQLPEDVEEANKRSEQYRVLYESAKGKRKLMAIVIAFLILLIGLMMAMVYFNYSTYDEANVIDKYSSWEMELEQREEAIRAKEKRLGIVYDEDEDEATQSASDASDNSK